MNRDLLLLSPIWLAALGGLVVLSLDLLTSKKGSRQYLAYVTSVFLVASAALCWSLWREETALSSPYLASVFLLDPYVAFFGAVTLLAAAAASLFAVGHLKAHEMDRGEFYTLLSLSATGALLFLSARDFVTLFLGLEIMSLAAYVLAASKKQSPYATEAGMKYFVLGGVGSAMLLFGVALLYGATGTFDIVEAASYFATHDPSKSFLLPQFSMILLAAAFLFKIAAVPFHMWAPDVYEGSPPPVVVYMAAGIKAVGIAVLARVLLTVFQSPVFAQFPVSVSGTLLFLSLLTMTLSNLMGLVQGNVKRVLAYSSIAHAGYIMLGVYATVGSKDASVQVLNFGVPFYVLTYAIASAGAFGVVALVTSDGTEDASLENFSGLARRRPYLALMLALCLLSLAGVPPLAGFMGKFVLFREILRANPHKNLVYVVIAVLNSVVALYYYLRIAVYMYFREQAATGTEPRPLAATGIVVATLVGALLLHVGVFPSRYLTASSQVARASTVLAALEAHHASARPALRVVASSHGP